MAIGMPFESDGVLQAVRLTSLSRPRQHRTRVELLRRARERTEDRFGTVVRTRVWHRTEVGTSGVQDLGQDQQRGQ